MGTTQFLKPDRRKIFLFIFLILISPVFYPRDMPLFIAIHMPWIRMILSPFAIFLCEFRKCFQIAFLIIPFSTIFYYLISSLIVWIYDKFKKKTHYNTVSNIAY
jgi:hypothetical protein